MRAAGSDETAYKKNAGTGIRFPHSFSFYLSLGQA